MTPAQLIFAQKFPGLVKQHGLQRYFATPPLTQDQLRQIEVEKRHAAQTVARQQAKPVSKFACNQRWEKDGRPQRAAPAVPEIMANPPPQYAIEARSLTDQGLKNGGGPAPAPEPITVVLAPRNTRKQRYVVTTREMNGIPSRAECRARHLCVECGKPAKELRHGFGLKCAGCIEIRAKKKQAKLEQAT